MLSTGSGYGKVYQKRFSQYIEGSDSWKKLHIARGGQ